MDDLLNRADSAIRESRIVRDESRQDLAAARVRETLQLARIERERSVNLHRQSAKQALAGLKEQTLLLPGETH